MTLSLSLAALLASGIEAPERPALWSPAGPVAWRELASQFEQRWRQLKDLSGQRVGLALRADAPGIAALAALERLGCHAFLLDADLPEAQQAAWCEQLQLAALVPSSAQATPPAAKPPTASGPGSVTILTSGTTGEPKAVRHGWTNLVRPVRCQATSRPPCWLLAFRPHLYAGLQVILQALLNQGTLVVVPPQAEPMDAVELMAKAGVEFASATPSYWRRLLMSSDVASQQRVPLAQITLGGEVADQAILDQLHKTFPAARLVHIYATTELGRCFSVTDGRAGFPRSLLDQPSSDGVELQIRDGQLWVRSANAMSGYDPQASPAQARSDAEGWFATGDQVEQRSDRVYFVGRNSDMINVGGNKVYPLAVERVIRQIPDVAEVRVYGHASSLAGQLVACQVVPHRGPDDPTLRQRIREHCQQRLDRYQCPRLIEIVDQLPLSDAGKLLRRDT